MTWSSVSVLRPTATLINAMPLENDKSENTTPLISVVLPVYNGAAYVRMAIDSILRQTFGDFELIVIDDGSVDETAQIIGQVVDPRLQFICQKNKGLATTLNQGIALARGKYIARQDHDDISLPTRFEKQVTFLEAHPDYALLGTDSIIWEEDRPTDRGHHHATDDPSLQFALLFDNYFVHSSVMLRRDVIIALGGYSTDPTRQPPEDYELWSRVARHHKVANLQEQLLIYREVPGSLSRAVGFKDKLVKISSENLAHAVGLENPDNDIQNIAALIHRAPDLLRGPLRYSRMDRIIRHAGHSIFKEIDGDAKIEARVSQLKWHFALIKYDGLPHWMKRPTKAIHSRMAFMLQKIRQIKQRFFMPFKTKIVKKRPS
jgi:glycosyltransferase involved in cell wall biosynthesis